MRLSNFRLGKQRAKIESTAEKLLSQPPIAGSLADGEGDTDAPVLDPYALADREIIGGYTVPALWARALVAGSGEGGATKAVYVKLRVAQLEGAAKTERLKLVAFSRKSAEREALRAARIRKRLEENQRTDQQLFWLVAVTVAILGAVAVYFS